MIDNVLKMSGEQLEKFLCKKEQYLPISLPPYFEIEKLLNNDVLNNNSKKENYLIKQSKKGKYDWRTITIINPLFYIEMVNYLKDKWEEIKCILNSKIDEMKNIKIVSIPFQSNRYKNIKGANINNWYINFEQKSLLKSFDYKYCQMTDISNCYPSMYTHSIAWALHGKEEAKHKKTDDNLIGNCIDRLIREMQDNQTNGIPQGGTLTDIIAEIILIDVDYQLFKKCADYQHDYEIIRYRDDYRIFSNSKDILDKVLSELITILEDYNLRLNPEKTKLVTDFSSDLIKRDKKIWKFIDISLWYKEDKNKKYKVSIKNHLLFIKEFSNKYPNSGHLSLAIESFYDHLLHNKYVNIGEISSCIIILKDILIKNVNLAPKIIACLHELFLQKRANKEDVLININQILNVTKMDKKLEYIELWIQYLAILWDVNSEIEYTSRLCKLVQNQGVYIFAKVKKNKTYNTMLNRRMIKEKCKNKYIFKRIYKLNRNQQNTYTCKNVFSVDIKHNFLVSIDSINSIRLNPKIDESIFNIFEY